MNYNLFILHSNCINQLAMKTGLTKTFLILSATALVLGFLAACNDKITHVPVIESIDLDPDTVMVGESSMLQIKAVDKDDENLVFYYTATGGSIEGVGDTVVWLAPEEAGVYMARVLVSDKDGNQAVDSTTLVVLKNDSSTRITGVAAFSAGIDLDLADSKVRLFTSLQNMADGNVFASFSTEGFGSIVSFRLDDIPAGTYYLEIWKDTDYGNTQNAGDYYGWYGNGDILSRNPVPLVLQSGSLKVIQVQMWVIPSK